MPDQILLPGRRQVQMPLNGLVPSIWQFYPSLVLGMEPTAYWPLTETKVSNAPYHNSSLTPEVTLPAANLDTPFDGDAGTAMVWFKVSGAGVWTDGTLRAILRFYGGASNEVVIYKDSISSRVFCRHKGGGTSVQKTLGSFSSTSWVFVACTWDTVADEFRMFYNGVELGTASTGLGTWTGTLVGPTGIGRAAEAFSGWIAHAAVWNSVLTPTQINTTLYQAGSPSVGYEDIVNGLSPFAYWPCNEKTGSTADNYEGTASYDGTYDADVVLADAIFADYPTIDNAEGTAALDGTPYGLLLADESHLGQPAPYYDGVNDYVQLSPSAVDAVFDSTKGALGGWCKIPSAVWTDGSYHYLVQFRIGITDIVHLTKAFNNRWGVTYEGQDVIKSISEIGTPTGRTDWFHALMTWDTVADELKAYIDGVQWGSTVTSLTPWGAGTINVTYIGQSNTGTRWEGWMQHIVLFDRVPTLPEIQQLALV